MCIIIDANVASKTFTNPPDEDFLPVIDWLTDKNKNGCLVYGGRLSQELDKLADARRYLRVLNQAGRAIQMPDKTIDTEEKRIKELCQSDDPHIIALARISRVRTLCSHDKTLHKDFKNRELISDPRGAVYQNPEHAALLRHTRSCPKYRDKD